MALYQGQVSIIQRKERQDILGHLQILDSLGLILLIFSLNLRNIYSVLHVQNYSRCLGDNNVKVIPDLTELKLLPKKISYSSELQN